MVTKVTPPSTTRPIINEDLTMSQELRTWTQIVTNVVPIIGAGTPETFIEADQRTLYMDDAGTAGNILYIKRDADIAGDKTKGWILA